MKERCECSCGCWPESLPMHDIKQTPIGNKCQIRHSFSIGVWLTSCILGSPKVRKPVGSSPRKCKGRGCLINALGGPACTTIQREHGAQGSAYTNVIEYPDPEVCDNTCQDPEGEIAALAQTRKTPWPYSLTIMTRIPTNARYEPNTDRKGMSEDMSSDVRFRSVFV